LTKAFERVAVSARFERVAVIGLGLLGGSVAGAARERGVAKRVVGISRGRDNAAAALSAGLVDESTCDIAAGVAGADLVVLCTPVFAMAETLGRAAPHLAPRALVSDVGSVKARLVETLPGLLPAGVHYVGAHPMAGSHATGLRHARADLFEGAACVLTPSAATPPAALARVHGFWAALGARIFERDPAQHDAEVAWVSHLPHALAFAYAASLGAAPSEAFALQGSGFRDFTRIAASDPELWADIFATNAKALAAPLAASAAALLQLSRAIEAGDLEMLHRLLVGASEALATANEAARSGGRAGNSVAPAATPKE
jgi:cyclohexadieny/prephenate dehydrogenase